MKAHTADSRMENTDVEKGSVSDVKDHASTSPSYSTNGVGEPSYVETTIIHQSFGRKLFESFKRDPNRTATPIGVIGANGRVFDGKGAAKATASSPLARRLKGRHLQMIAIGGSIGKFLTADFNIRSNDRRHWSFRRIWEGSRSWRTRISPDMLFTHRDDVILHRTRTGRNGSLVSSGWIVLSVFYSVLGPSMGICYGMGTLLHHLGEPIMLTFAELCHAMAGCFAT
jgi:hypothetical protein